MTDRLIGFKRFFGGTASTQSAPSTDSRSRLIGKDFMRFDLTGSARSYLV
jgi:hypothetical protein